MGVDTMVKKKAVAYVKFTLTLKRTGSSVWQSDGIERANGRFRRLL